MCERACVGVCVCHNEEQSAKRMASTTSDTDDNSSKQQHVCVCHNEKKMPDKWQARQVRAVILQVRSSKHKAKKSGARVCVCACIRADALVCARDECVRVGRERERERETKPCTFVACQDVTWQCHSKCHSHHRSRSPAVRWTHPYARVQSW